MFVPFTVRLAVEERSVSLKEMEYFPSSFPSTSLMCSVCFPLEDRISYFLPAAISCDRQERVCEVVLASLFDVHQDWLLLQAERPNQFQEHNVRLVETIPW